jgi:hypothetical protein
MPNDFTPAVVFDDAKFNRVIEIYKVHRARIVHEDHLINWRTTWFIAMQSVFVLSISIFAGNLSGIQLNLLASILAFAGYAVCATTFISVRAAQITIRDIVDEWDEVVAAYPDLLLPRLAGSKRGKRIIPKGGTSSICMPVAFAFVWTAILAAIWLFDTPLTQFNELINGLTETLGLDPATGLQTPEGAPPVTAP